MCASFQEGFFCGVRVLVATVGGNPPDSKWRNTPASKRHRKHVHLTLAPAVLVLLTRLAKAEGVSRSLLVERLVRRAAAKIT